MKFVLLSIFTLVAATGSLQAASAEQQLAEAIKAPGVSVVHLWAPWCSNCKAELKNGGWTKIVKENPTIKFYFVSIWNGGADGRELLATYDLSQQPNVTILADPGPRGTNHLKQFVGLPVSWIPTTWVFKRGELHYALNYGEIRFPILQQLIADSNSEW
jgi:thiol-disulfide isomerase/thioredoxin